MRRRPPGPPLFPYTTLFRSPHTRSMGDTEGKTQLLDATAGGATQRMPATQAPAGKKRSLVPAAIGVVVVVADRKSTRLNSSHVEISYAVFCLKKKTCRQ